MTRDYGHHEPPWSVVANDRDEYRSAANRAPVWREPQPPTLDDLRDLADEWGDDD